MGDLLICHIAVNSIHLIQSDMSLSSVKPLNQPHLG